LGKTFSFPQDFKDARADCVPSPGSIRAAITTQKESEMISSRTIRCAAALLAVMGSAMALAESPQEPMKAVGYSDLNLTTQTGVAALYQRIEHAAADVCQLPQGTRQLKIESEIKVCRKEATDRAISQANLPALTTMHFEKTGRRVDGAQYADRR
jgi:UrcA family protein